MYTTFLILTRLAIILSYFVLGAYSTTDIIRLLKGSTTPMMTADCYCPVCNSKIRLIDQVPTIAYLLNHGRCRSCKTRIPKNDFILEIIVYSGCIILAVVLNFSWISFFLMIVYYETVKILFLIKNGVREKDFIKNLVISLSSNLILFVLIFALFYMEHIVNAYM